jgi:glycosyltransferase involved in cell wall biosynthesis
VPVVHYVDHQLFRIGGHPFNMALGFAAECRARGLACRVHCHRKAAPELVARLGARARFPYRSNDRKSREATPEENFARHGKAFAAACAELTDEGCGADDLVVVSMASQDELSGVARWLAGVGAARAPRVALQMQYDNLPEPSAAREDAGPFGALYREAVRPLATPALARRVLLAAPTAPHAEKLRRITGLEVRVLPLAMHLDAALCAAAGAPIPPPGSPRVLAFLGNSAPYKGFPLLPRVLAPVFAARPEARARVQLLPLFASGPMTFDEALGRALPPAARAEWAAWLAEPVTRERVAWRVGELSPDEYYAQLAEADVVLVPYDPVGFRGWISAVFIEACAAGRPVVVPRESWMGERVLSGDAAGAVFDAWTAEEIAAATLRALDAYPELAARARARAEAWQRDHGIARLLDGVLAWAGGEPLAAAGAR